MRARLVSLACAAALAPAIPSMAHAAVPEAPAAEAGARADPKPAEPLCIVEVTDADGVPLAPMALVSFKDGVYHLRTEDGREIERPEADVECVSFLPLEDAADGERSSRADRRVGERRRERDPSDRDDL